MVDIARRFRECSSLPIAIQANAGLPVFRNGSPVYSETPEAFAAHARSLLDLGVAIVGGCCGTGPEHVRALREMVDRYSSND
jgi:5-methyltetrahydrofolate--homocysteine methyltransferase